MSTQKSSFGSITIVDIGDIGEFSVYPQCNLPLSVSYAPDSDTYIPNWGTNNLVITPSIWYGSSRILPTAQGMTVTWTRKEGISSATALTTGETAVNGVLTVSANKFTPSIPMITYIVTCSYTEPTTNDVISAQGEITFTLSKQGVANKSASITGEAVFKYNTDGTLVGNSSITLTGRVTSVSITGWQYRTSNGIYTTYPNSGATSTLTVNATDSIFTNDTATIKLLTDDNAVYDLHTITKIRDGAAGEATVSAVLTNETQMIPYVNGQGDFTGAVCSIVIYSEGVDATSLYTITQSYSGVTATASTTTATNDTVTVSDMSGSTGYVKFRAVLTSDPNSTPIIKVYNIVKVEGTAGESPVIYSIEPSTLAITKSINNTYTPSTVTFYNYQTVGNSKTAYSGRLKIYENIEASSITPSSTAVYTSSANETSYTYTPSVNATVIVGVLYEKDGFTTVLDKQTVAIANDGKTGAAGINIIFGNTYDGIPTDSNGVTPSAYSVVIPFDGYKGIKKVATNVTGTVPTLLGITPTVVNATTQASGSITYNIPQGTTVFSDGGTLTFTFSIEGTTATCTYSWGKFTGGKDGENATSLLLQAPHGNIIGNGNASVEITAILIEGANNVTSSATYKWYKYVISGSSGSYVQISGETTNVLTVIDSMVDNYASFKCEAVYNTKTYIGYMSIMDKQDPIQVSVFSTIGDRLINGQGVGALYVRVYKQNTEIDPIVTENFVTALPSSASSGDYCYLVDSGNKVVTLYKYTTGWTVATEPYVGTYAWSYRDKDGNTITTGILPTSGKAIYIDGSYIDEKLIVDVEVTV